MSNCTNNFIKRVIGVTRTFKWTITTNGAAVPLVADDLTLQLVPPRGEAVSLPFDVDDNIVSFTWQGEDQHIIGCYSLILWANYGEDNQRRVDIHNFVELIPWSDRQSGEYSDLVEETIELETADFGENIMVVDNLNSTSATDALSANMGRQLNVTKQDVIQDLATIRSGAAAGAAVKKWAKNDPLITDDATQVSASKLAFNGNLFEQWVPGIASSIGLKGIAGFLKLADISQWDSAYNDRMLPTVAAVKAKLQAVLTALATIEAVIPSQASSTNKLTDKDYVDGAIATNTANFVGTFDTVAELQAVQNPTKNDYGFVIETDAQGNEYYDRYKYTGTQWLFEYKVESTPFTAEQWAAIQSGITAALVSKLSALPTNAELNTALASKQPVINDLTTIRSGAAAGATAYQKPSGGIPASDMAAAVQTSLGKADAAAPQSTTYTKAEVDAALATKQTSSQLATINGSRIDQGGNVTIVAAEGQTITIDAAPTEGSNNAVSSGGVYPLVEKTDEFDEFYQGSSKTTSNLYNRFDPDCINNSRLTSTGGINSYDGLKISGYIPVVPGSKYIVKPATYQRGAWYNASKEFLQTQDNFAGWRTAPAGAAYLRATVTMLTDASTYCNKDTDSGFAPYRVLAIPTIQTTDIADSAVTAPKMANGSVTTEKTDFFITDPSGNLYNQNDPDCVNSAVINQSTGAVSVSSSYATRKVSGWIAVAPGQQYCGGTELGTCAWYNSSKEFIESFNDMSASTPKTAPNNAAFLRVTLYIARDGASNFIKKGANGAYSDYREILPNQYIDVESIRKNPIAVEIPSKIYAVCGDTLQLFYRSMFKCIDPYIYDIKVVTNCAAVRADGKPAVKAFPRYIEILMPDTEAGNTYDLTVSINDNNGMELGSKTATLVVSSAGYSPSSQVNVLIVGDSTPRNGVMPDELLRRLTGTGGTPAGSGFSNITLVGRQVGTNPGSVAKIECGGASFNSYIAEDSSNPFYHNGAIDMDWYVDTYCEGKVDIILTTLFANGTQAYASNVSNIMLSFRNFVAQCRASTRLANVKFGIGLEFNYDLRGGLGNLYGANGGWSDWYGMCLTHYAILDELEKWILDNNEENNVFVMNLLNEFDCENGYPEYLKKRNIRLPDSPVTGVVEEVTEPFGNNGVHPHDYGRMMFSDTAWRLLISKFCQE